MKPLLRLLAILRPVSGWLLLGGVLSLITLLANVALMGLAGWFIAAMALAGVAGNGINYFTPAAVIRACAMLRTGGRYGERLLTHAATLRLLTQLRVWFYEHIEPLAPAGLEAYRSGDLLSRLRADIDTLDHFYLRLLLPTVVALFATAIFLLFLFLFNPRLALIEGAMLALAGIFLPLFTLPAATPRGARIVELKSALRSELVTGLQGLGELLIDAADQRHADRIRQLSLALDREQRAMNRLGGFSQGAVASAANLTMWCLTLSAIPMVHNDSLPPAQLAMLAFFALASFEAIAPLPAAFLGLGETLAAARRLFAGVDAAAAVSEPRAAAPLPSDLTLKLERITFSYRAVPGNAVHEISLSLTPGKRLALVGPSGSGKSTLLQLILKFRTPDSGLITLGGVPLDALSGEALRGPMAVVSQHPHLFNASLRENLRLAAPEASQESLERACRTALIHDFIAAQPEGYDTLAGEFGVRLSGGQVKRLAVARALLKEAPILILDEPTEGLDPHTARQLMDNLLRWGETRSLLLVTHRLQGLETMDEILLLHEGGVVDRGSHAQLLAHNKNYTRLRAC